MDEVLLQAQTVSTSLVDQRRVFDSVGDKVLQVGMGSGGVCACACVCVFLCVRMQVGCGYPTVCVRADVHVWLFVCGWGSG